MNKVGAFVAFGMTALLAGCTSVSSTVLNRQDDDVFVGNSNGTPRGDGRPRPFKGVPITVHVPTHLDIAIKENILLWRAPNGKMQRIKTAKRSLFVEATCVETDKVFMVDVKRPLAGILNYTLTFGKNVSGGIDNSQYFSQLQTHIQDTTINDVNTALQSILPILQAAPAKQTSGTAPGGSAPLDDSITSEVRTVAWKRFDLDAPDFHQQMATFVEQHLNCCNDCHEYPDVNDAPRSAVLQMVPTNPAPPAASQLAPAPPAPAPPAASLSAPESGFGS